ncbi:MAG: hypothetical protein Q9217_005214 [Psora testacea]
MGKVLLLGERSPGPRLVSRAEKVAAGAERKLRATGASLTKRGLSESQTVASLMEVVEDLRAEVGALKRGLNDQGFSIPEAASVASADESEESEEEDEEEEWVPAWTPSPIAVPLARAEVPGPSPRRIKRG